MLSPKVKASIFLVIILVVAASGGGDCIAGVDNFSQQILPADKNQVDDSSKIFQQISPADPDDTIPVSEGVVKSDSVILEPILYTPGDDSLLMNIYRSQDTSAGERRSPTKTMFKSVIFPGWGQFSNRRYIKAAAIFGIESYFIYKAVDNGQQASDWRTKWKEAPDELKSVYFSEYTNYRDTRNTYIWYTALTIFLSMFDAYVDAHLMDFPNESGGSDKLSMDVVPGEETRLTFRYNF